MEIIQVVIKNAISRYTFRTDRSMEEREKLRRQNFPPSRISIAALTKINRQLSTVARGESLSLPCSHKTNSRTDEKRSE